MSEPFDLDQVGIFATAVRTQSSMADTCGLCDRRTQLLFITSSCWLENLAGSEIRLLGNLTALFDAITKRAINRGPGLGLQRLLLVATKEGYSTSYLNQPAEVPDLRMQLAGELSIVGYPHVLLRVGRVSLFRILHDGRYRTC